MGTIQDQKKLTNGKGFKMLRSSLEEKGYPESHIEKTIEHAKDTRKALIEKRKNKKEKAKIRATRDFNVS
jgi:hypothetical protein